MVAKMVEDLLNEPRNQKYKRVYYDFEQDIMRIDFTKISYLVPIWRYLC